MASGGQITVKTVFASGSTSRLAAAETFERVADEQPAAQQQVAEGSIGRREAPLQQPQGFSAEFVAWNVHGG